MEEPITNIESTPKVRTSGVKSNYMPDTVHQDVIYFSTDEKNIYLNGESYGNTDKIAELNLAIGNIRNIKELNINEVDEGLSVDIVYDQNKKLTGTIPFVSDTSAGVMEPFMFLQINEVIDNVMNNILVVPEKYVLVYRSDTNSFTYTDVVAHVSPTYIPVFLNNPPSFIKMRALFEDNFGKTEIWITFNLKDIKIPYGAALSAIGESPWTAEYTTSIKVGSNNIMADKLVVTNTKITLELDNPENGKA